jgi:hypothetical protein
MEDENVYRIQFDATLDDIVDAHLRLTTRSQRIRIQRARAIWIAGACLSGGLLATVFFRSRQHDVELSAATWGIVIAAALTLGAGFGYLYGVYLNRTMRQQYRRIAAEQLDGAGDVRVDIELRREGAWVAQRGVEIIFAWSNAAGIEDTGDAIELRFRPGLVVARNRAFRDAAERERFLERARALSNSFRVPA